MKNLTILMSALLCGCAYTPMELRQASASDNLHTTQPPNVAAACVARNLDETEQGLLSVRYQTNIRAGSEPGATELLGRVAEQVQFVGDFTPNNGGAKAQIWFHPNLADFWRERIRASFAGC